MSWCPDFESRGATYRLDDPAHPGRLRRGPVGLPAAADHQRGREKIEHEAPVVNQRLAGRGRLARHKLRLTGRGDVVVLRGENGQEPLGQPAGPERPEHLWRQQNLGERR